MENITNICKKCIPDNIKKEINLTKEWIEKNIMSKEEHKIEYEHLINGIARSHSLLQQIVDHINKG